MSQYEKGSPEWKAQKEEARKQLDANLAAGLPHGTKLPTVGASLGASKPRASKPKAKKQ